MTKFHGPVGYASESVETQPGVWVDSVEEREYFGDILRESRQLDSNDKVNFDITTGNSISIVADAYAMDHFFAIRYVVWAGTRWVVTNVDVKSPRLILRLGGVYNGPEVATPYEA